MGAVMTLRSGKGSRAIVEVNKDSGDFLVFYKDTVEVFSVDINGLPDTTCNQQYFYESVNIGDIVADSDAITPVIFFKQQAATLVGIYLSCDEDKALDAANYQTIAVLDESANSIVSLAWTAAFDVDTDVPLTMGSLSGTHKILTAGEHAYATFTKTLNGQAISGLTFHILYTVES